MPSLVQPWQLLAHELEVRLRLHETAATRTGGSQELDALIESILPEGEKFQSLASYRHPDVVVEHSIVIAALAGGSVSGENPGLDQDSQSPRDGGRTDSQSLGELAGRVALSVLSNDIGKHPGGHPGQPGTGQQQGKPLDESQQLIMGEDPVVVFSDQALALRVDSGPSAAEFTG